MRQPKRVPNCARCNACNVPVVRSAAALGQRPAKKYLYECNGTRLNKTTGRVELQFFPDINNSVNVTTFDSKGAKELLLDLGPKPR